MSGGYEDDENLMSVPDDDGYGDSSNMSSSSSEDDFSQYEDEEQLMSIDPSYDEPNMSYADGPGHSDHYSDPESSMMCSYDYGTSDLYANNNNPYCSDMSSYNDAGMSYITDSPTNPHAVLDIIDDVVGTTDGPYAYLVAIGSDGERSHDKIRVNKKKAGYLYWNTLNATNITLNGIEVDATGSMEIPFTAINDGSYWPYELLAWNDDLSKAEYAVIDVHFLQDFAEGLEFERSISIPEKPIERSYKYFDIEYNASLGLKGSFAFNDGNANRTYKWQDGIAVELTKEFKSGNWKFEPKVEFAAPVLAYDSEEEVMIEIKVAGEGTYTVELSDNNNLVFSFEISATIIEVSRERMPDADWEPSVLELEIKGAVKWSGKIKTDSGTFTGTVSGALIAKVNPNWTAILAELTKKFGPRLGIGIAKASLGLVVGVVSSPAFIAGAAVAIVVFGVYKIIESNGPKNFREEVIPDLINAFNLGIRKGLEGTSSRSENVAVTDNYTASVSGIYIGAKIKQELEANNEPYKHKSAADQQAILSAVQGAARSKLEINLWIQQAGPLKEGSWFSSDREDCAMQMSWWNNIIGDCPRSKGGQYPAVWDKYVIDCPDHWAYDGHW